MSSIGYSFRKCVSYTSFIVLKHTMALQPFVGPWPLFQFLDPINSRLDSLDGGSARDELFIYTHNITNID
jgi:hypothetical protein